MLKLKSTNPAGFRFSIVDLLFLALTVIATYYYPPGLFGDSDADNDGTVFVDEAILTGCTDSTLLDGAHTGFLFNKNVIMQCHHFIQHKKFKK